jgi:hypothetical protein
MNPLDYLTLLLTPLVGKEHCDILFYLLVVSLFFVIVSVVAFAGSFFSKKVSSVLTGIAVVQMLVVHYLYMLGYSICLRSM